ncbi:TPA: DUF4116 domain-containing protein [Pseudomonas aeruginosa]
MPGGSYAGWFCHRIAAEKLHNAEICLEAVKQNGRAIEYVPFSMMTDEMHRMAGIEHM